MAADTKTLQYLISFQVKGQAEMALLQSQMKTLGLSVSTLGGSMKTVSSDATNFGNIIWNLAKRAALTIPIWMALRAIIVNFAMQGTWRVFEDAIKFSIELENALTEIKIVGKGTAEEISKLKSEILALGIVLGTSSADALQAARIFAQQGLAMADVSAATKAAMLGSQVLGQDIATVAENLTAAIRSYNLEFDDSISLIDKWIRVQKNFAVTAKDLADATRTAGATAASFGISYEQFLGNITAIIETTRKSGSQAANALQMIYTRLFTQGKDAIQTIAQVPIYLDASGQATFQTTHIFRAAGDVLADVAKNWQNLTEAQKIQLATQIGSRRQVTPFIALMNNYSRSVDATTQALNSSGDALAALSLKQETLSFKTNQLQAAWKSLVGEMDNLSSLKTGVDLLTDMLLVVRSLTLAFHNFQVPNIGASIQNALPGFNFAPLIGQTWSAITKSLRGKLQSQLFGSKTGSVQTGTPTLSGAISTSTQGLTPDLTAEEQARIVQHRAELLKIVGRSESEVLSYMLEQYTTAEKIDGVTNKLILDEKARTKALEIQRDLIESQFKMIMKYSDLLQDAFSGALEDWFSSDKTFTQAAQSIGDAVTKIFRGTLSKSLTRVLFDNTGMGTAFGEAMSWLEDPISGAFIRGANAAAPILTQAMVNGALQTTSGRSSSVLSGNALGFLNLPFGGQQTMIGSQMGYRTSSGGKPYSTYGQMIGGAAVGLMTGYSTYQAMANKGANPIMAGTAGVLGGYGAMAMMMPGGQAIGAALMGASMLMQMFSSGKNSQTTVETKETMNQVASKIDISNNRLELINRNLIALRQEITYILPNSAYFSESRNLTDQFSLDMRRG